MATVLFAAAGAALGAGFGGTVLGLSGAVIGRAVGATVGRVVDQKIMGLGSDPVEVGRLDRFHVMGASEGTSIAKSWGRMRLPGQVIWASPFTETTRRTGSGKGAPSPRTVQFSYTVSLAIALCEGEILGVGRIWADGTEIAPTSLDYRVYHGTETQLPDPVIEAVMGSGMAPAYRGTAYVVIENLALANYGNRVPQLSFEVMRIPNGEGANQTSNFQTSVRAVAVIPGTGEYALSPETVALADGPLNTKTVNINNRSGKSDFSNSMDQLQRELPNCKAASLVVSWFGDDLRCNQCQIKPKVEQIAQDSARMPWTAGGIVRSAADAVPMDEGKSIYGGTPADASVIKAIQALHEDGLEVMFYPFVLMEQLDGNTLADPYSDQIGQPKLPWRGRITLSTAPGRPNTPDQTETARAEVEAFFGSAQPADFQEVLGRVQYSGPQEWSFRRFILHYAKLCQMAGGVDAFIIGSEMRGLTTIRGADHTFPAVAALIQLAADVRSILGPLVKISYAADWSEYFGYHVNGNVYFHLDDLWASPGIDFIGIDNYMPLSDWREGRVHADSAWGSIYNLNYLKSNIAGGELFDWFYDGPEGQEAQNRKAIEDGAYGEAWVFRPKDIASWWSLPHYERIAGTRSANQTAWVPASKPIWFTEYGCAAVNLGTNEPNKFLDLKSSESALPKYSNGAPDEFMQMQYFRAMGEFWSDQTNNPASTVYSGQMVDTEHCFAWAWDVRPFPEFPRNAELWADSPNYTSGHWLNGRAASVPLESVVRDVCNSAGIGSVSTKDLYGLVKGYSASDSATARAILQPLGVAHGFDAIEKEGELVFLSRKVGTIHDIEEDHLVLDPETGQSSERTRLSDDGNVNRSRLVHVSSDGDFSTRVSEFTMPGADVISVAQSEYAMALSSSDAKVIVERWLIEADSARDLLKVHLPPSASEITAGSILRTKQGLFRVDRLDSDEAQIIEAVGVEESSYDFRSATTDVSEWVPFVGAAAVHPVWMDLPPFREGVSAFSPYVAISANPWPGQVGVWVSESDAGYELATIVDQPATIGTTLSPMASARAGLLDRGAPLRVQLVRGDLSATSMLALLNGGNFAAIGDGSAANWEIFQFANAELVGPNTFDLTLRLRGQVGTDADVPEEWPVGSIFVLLDEAVVQVPMSDSLRGVERHFRVGSTRYALDDPNVDHQVLSFEGVGLRPYAVSHLTVDTDATNTSIVRWIRRTREGGDNWLAYEVPLGETREQYLVLVREPNGVVVRQNIVQEQTFTYTAGMKAADGITTTFSVEVAQLSDSYGPGAPERVTSG